jgi:hypothetical protein
MAQGEQRQDGHAHGDRRRSRLDGLDGQGGPVRRRHTGLGRHVGRVLLGGEGDVEPAARHRGILEPSGRLHRRSDVIDPIWELDRWVDR